MNALASVQSAQDASISTGLVVAAVVAVVVVVLALTLPTLIRQHREASRVIREAERFQREAVRR